MKRWISDLLSGITAVSFPILLVVLIPLGAMLVIRNDLLPALWLLDALPAARLAVAALIVATLAGAGISVALGLMYLADMGEVMDEHFGKKRQE